MIDEDEDDLPENAPDDAADPKQADRKRRRKRKASDEAAEFWQGIFATEIGRRELWGLLEAGGFSTTRFDCGPNGFPQPEATWFHAGEHALVHRFYDSWEILDYDGVRLMRREHDGRFPK